MNPTKFMGLLLGVIGVVLLAGGLYLAISYIGTLMNAMVLISLIMFAGGYYYGKGSLKDELHKEMKHEEEVEEEVERRVSKKKRRPEPEEEPEEEE